MEAIDPTSLLVRVAILAAFVYGTIEIHKAVIQALAKLGGRWRKFAAHPLQDLAPRFWSLAWGVFGGLVALTPLDELGYRALVGACAGMFNVGIFHAVRRILGAKVKHSLGSVGKGLDEKLD